MPSYRCYFLDEQGYIRGAANLEADTPAQAIDMARTMLKARPENYAIEIWQGTERLHLTPQKA